METFFIQIPYWLVYEAWELKNKRLPTKDICVKILNLWKYSIRFDINNNNEDGEKWNLQRGVW